LRQLVTYAQNREDLYLFALLGHVDQGFFVDIGAYHPVLHSVTKLFSDLGWNGINVEANRRLFEAFEVGRNRETNVCAAVSDSMGTVSFREYPHHDGLSTVSTGVQEVHAASFLPFVDTEVQSITLSHLFSENNVGKIDFLKVDVEGHEVEVLSSNDWSRWRPTVVTFEANRGQEAIDCVTAHGYHLEFFDGLNHYMVADEETDISILNFAGRILHPGFLTRREAELEVEVTALGLNRQGDGSFTGSRHSMPQQQLGVKGSALLLSKAIQKRIEAAKLGRQGLEVAARSSAALRTRSASISARRQVVKSTSVEDRGVQGSQSARVVTALASRASAVNDFFGGWTQEDVALFESWRMDLGDLRAEPGELLDWLGCRTNLSHHAWLQHSQELGLVVADIPVPDDQVHAEAIEYFALLTALMKAKERSFCVVELGASYAPWSVGACVVALRAGFVAIHGIAVEANASSLANIYEHVDRNRLQERGVRFDALHGAVSTSSEPLFFPVIDTAADNGAQATRAPGATDYRGVPQQYSEVPGLTLPLITNSLKRVDFLHMDLQGAEEGLLVNEEFLEALTDKVGVLMLATQSRLVEGLALRELSRRGWELLRERPTTFNPNDRTNDVNGWTLRDGAQVWANMAIVG
jgi:FkbM family methyltransferase